MSEPTMRRAFLRSACRHCVGFGALGLGLGAWASEGPKLPARFARPPVDTDEGGLWAQMDREEQRMRRSSQMIRDPALQGYLEGMIAKLAGDHAQDVRLQVVRTPHFNAMMAPNGLMQVWSGLLLRMDNEAQLAAVLGHELGHYLERHQVERLRDLKNKAAGAMVLSMFGLVGAIAAIGVQASFFGFSREQESRADRLGLQLMGRAGYDTREAATVWDNLLGELKIRGGDDVGQRSALFATHPPAGNRRDELIRLAAGSAGTAGSPEFERLIAPHRLEWLLLEVQRGQYEESLVLFDRMLRRRPEDAQVLFARGEVYRLRNVKDDTELAMADLVKASGVEKAPPETFRSLGMVLKRKADNPAAAAAFEKYLTLAPEAGDAGLIKTYLTELK